MVAFEVLVCLVVWMQGCCTVPYVLFSCLYLISNHVLLVAGTTGALSYNTNNSSFWLLFGLCIPSEKVMILLDSYIVPCGCYILFCLSAMDVDWCELDCIKLGSVIFYSLEIN